MRVRRQIFLFLLAALLAACQRWQSPNWDNAAVPASGRATGEAGIGYNPAGPNMALYADAAGRYPRGDRKTWWQPAYSVDGFSRLDEIFPAHVVAQGAAVSPWHRAAAEPPVTYAAPSKLGGGRHDIDGYMARNPTTGLLVAVADTIQIERYQYGRTDTQRLVSFSMAKTICALLVGLAVADGAIVSIDDPAEKYVPDLKGSEYGRTPIRNLLTMSSGVHFREEYDGNDDVQRLSRVTLFGAGGVGAVRQFNTRDVEPGRRWYYASAETQVLGLVLRATLNRSLSEYLAERVWQPMGAEADASWVADRTGQETAYANFSAVLRDYARLGRLLANGGRVGDRQVIPVDWLREMTRAHFSGADTGRWFGYGFQTWIFPENDGSFALLGVRGQTIFVDPARRLVMVHTAVRPQSRDDGGAEAVALWRGLRQYFPRQPR